MAMKPREAALRASAASPARVISALPRETPILQPTACLRQPRCVRAPAALPPRHADRAAARTEYRPAASDDTDRRPAQRMAAWSATMPRLDRTPRAPAWKP